MLAADPPFAVAVFTEADDAWLTLQALRLGVRGAAAVAVAWREGLVR